MPTSCSNSVRAQCSAMLMLVSVLGASPAHAQTTRDSAGVQIIELPTISTTRVAFRIADTPLVQLGGLRDDPREEFSTDHPLLGALRMPDGRTVVNDHSALKVFDATGRLLHVLGRRGSGPGEFGQTRSMCRGAGDTVIATDFSLRRASVFTAGGQFVQTISVLPRPTGTGCFSDGSFLMIASSRIDEAARKAGAEALYTDRIADFVRVSTSGRDVVPVGSWTAARFHAFESHIWVQVVRDHIYVGDTHLANVRIRDVHGKLTHEIRWRAPRVRVTAAIIERRLNRGQTELPPHVLEQRKRSFYLMPVQDTLPAFLRMQVDPLGRIWLQDYPVDALGAGWTVLGADGALLGRVEVPRPAGSNARDPVQIVEVLKDRVALRWLDDDGAVYLGYFALGRP